MYGLQMAQIRSVIGISFILFYVDAESASQEQVIFAFSASNTVAIIGYDQDCLKATGTGPNNIEATINCHTFSADSCNARVGAASRSSSTRSTCITCIALMHYSMGRAVARRYAYNQR